MIKNIIQLVHVVVVVFALVACGQQRSSGRNDKPLHGWKTTNPALLAQIIAQGVPAHVATIALAKYDGATGSLKRFDNLGIIDFTSYSGNKRFYMVNTSTGKVDFLHVAHGSGSDPNGTGTPQRFSNTPDSHMSSLGSYVVSEHYQMKGNGTAARLDGLEGTNSRARIRGIVLHSAKYVDDSLSKMGMSWGCPAVSLKWIKAALDRLSYGGFLYAYGPPQMKTFDDIYFDRLMLDPSQIWSDESAAPEEGDWGM